MIKLDNNYQIEADDRCYILYKVRDTLNKRTGQIEPVKRAVGYYTRLTSALTAYGDELERCAIQADTYTLSEVLGAVKESREELKHLLREALEVVEQI